MHWMQSTGEAAVRLDPWAVQYNTTSTQQRQVNGPVSSHYLLGVSQSGHTFLASRHSTGELLEPACTNDVRF
jgi:hypothetical protein